MAEHDNWYVLYTKSRKEKQVTSRLEERGITAYCPMVKTVRQWSDRKKKIETPLIPSCIFIKCKDTDRPQVFQVPGPSHYLFWLGKPAIVKNNELETMQNWLEGDISEAHVQDLKAGDTYVIENQDFNGQEGVITEVSKNRIQLILKELGIKITITKNQNA